MPDFRNCIAPSSAAEVAPFPAGLNDCVSGLRWLHQQASQFGVDAERIIIAGESGGANLSIATALSLKQAGELDKIQGLYTLCPYIAGSWPQHYASAVEFNGLQLSLHNNRWAMSYGMDAFEAKNPLAWPGFASVDDLRGLVPTAVTVNELDPLRDEGVEFYRLLLKAGVQARCQMSMGTSHGAEITCGRIEDIAQPAAAGSNQ